MTTQRVFLGVALAAMTLGLVACDQAKPAPADKGGAAKGAAAKGTENKDGPAAKAGDACTDYATELCKQLGDTSPGCGAAKKTTSLMPPAACKAGMADLAFTEVKVKEQGKTCAELTAKLCKDIGESTQSCEMVKKQTPSFPPERCTSMMEQYDKVLADLKRREDTNKPLDDEKRKAIEQEAVATFGPDTAKVTVVEFSDFQCPFCSRAATAVTDIKKKYEGKDVRFIFRQYPLSFHKQAHLAAQASLAAAKQGKFWQYHDEMFKNQKELERPKLEAYAKTAGLNMAEFKKALDDGTYKAAVDADLKLGEQVAVTGTPTMFVNGTRVSNPSDVAAISSVIDTALGK